TGVNTRARESRPLKRAFWCAHISPVYRARFVCSPVVYRRAAIYRQADDADVLLPIARSLITRASFH
ncbi:MAG: hypothetical protein JW981_02145, partial [Anaerolineae bacterium]|nr:hypothetical protein [Anaerolineae bacterium]